MENYITNEYRSFFKELKANNSKEWFDENRKRYNQFVKQAFENLVSDLLNEIKTLDPRIQLTYKDCIFRINRDIRFSKDKTPYKLNRSAVINIGGKKDKEIPGMYFEVDADFLRVYGGVYSPSTQQIEAIRQEISYNLKSFKKLRESKEFKNVFGEILGETYKRPPKNYEKEIEEEALLMNKSWYWMSKYALDDLNNQNLVEILGKHYQVMLPLNNFFMAPILELRENA